jgi:hypothetical protein
MDDAHQHIAQHHSLYSWWIYSPPDEDGPGYRPPPTQVGDEELRYPFTRRRAGRDGQSRLKPDWTLWTPEIDSDGDLQIPVNPPSFSVPAVRAGLLKHSTVRRNPQDRDQQDSHDTTTAHGSELFPASASLSNVSEFPLDEDNWRGQEYAPRHRRRGSLPGFLPAGTKSDVLRGVNPFHPRRIFEFFARSSVDVALRVAITAYMERVSSLGALDSISCPSNDNDLCASCAKIDWLSLFFAGWEGDYSETIIFANLGDRHSMPLFQDMVRNPDCPFCRLIARAVTRKAPEVLLFDFSLVDIKVNMSVDLKRLNRFGAYLLEIDLERYEDPTNDQEYYLVDFELVLEKDSCLPHRLFRSGRKMNPDLDLSRLTDWWTTCQRSHSKCQEGPKPNDMQSSLEDRFVLRLIDVRQRRVIIAPAHCRYLAINYVWGKSQVYRASKSDFVNWEPFSPSKKWPVCPDQYMDLPVHHLPKTIRDAMRVTESLGERYLWVDALCIVQDDSEELAASIGNMHQVYRGGVMTIVAAGGTDADADLPGLDPGSRDVCDVSETIRGLTVMLPGPSLAGALKSSIWATRGWTYQELIFSRKMLVFTSDQVYYKCAHDIVCEDRVEAGPFLNAFPSDDDPYSRVPQETRHEIRYQARKPTLDQLPWFEQYEQHVADFTKRQLGFPSDALNACQAILNQYGRACNFSWGLPLERFENALLWGCAHAIKQQVLLRRSDGGERADTPTIVAARRNPAGFPSWSWAGWIGPTAYYGKPSRDLEPVVVWPWEEGDSEDRQAVLREIAQTGILEFETFTVYLDMERQARSLQSYCMNDGSILREGVRELIEVSTSEYNETPTGRVVWALFIHWEDGVAYRDGWASIYDQEWYEAGVTRKIIRLG